MCLCVRVVRTGRKSLARVLTAIALNLSLCVSCNACCDAVCVHATPPLCVWALLRAPPPIGLKCCVCHMSSDKSLARVLTAIALDLSLCVSCNACCDAVCVHATCVWALLRAPPPIGLTCCVSVWCDQGGAIYVSIHAQVDIRGSVLSNNQAVRGGGGALARHER
eukprot:COSAG06_NODE_10713_length_1630_cov_24.267146_2_plen_165_part_00